MSDRKVSKARRCQAAIYKRDTYRYTGRGKGGFEMHHRQEQCSRAAVKDGLCYQHQRQRFGNVTRLDWHEFMEAARGRK